MRASGKAVMGPIERQVPAWAELIDDANGLAVDRNLRLPCVVETPAKPAHARPLEFAFRRGADFVGEPQHTGVTPLAGEFDITVRNPLAQLRVEINEVAFAATKGIERPGMDRRIRDQAKTQGLFFRGQEAIEGFHVNALKSLGGRSLER